MASTNKVWGQTRVSVDGLYLQTEGKNTFDIGGVERTSVDGDNRAGFFNEKTAPSQVEVSILMTGDVSLAALQAIDDATVVHECDTGQVYIIRHAYVSGKISASDGKAKVTFMGPPAEEELA